MSSNEMSGAQTAEVRPQFRGALNGYRKEDVNRYVSYINSNFRGIETTLKNTITAQKDELSALQNEADLLRRRADEGEEKAAIAEELEKQNDVLRTQCEEFRRELEDVQRELGTEKEKNLALRAETNALRLQTERLEAEQQQAAQSEQEPAAPAADEETLRKAAQYDMITESLGSFLKNAAEQAQAVVENARAEAQKILDDANHSVNQDEINRAKRELNERFRRLSEECWSDVAARIDSVQTGLSSLAEDIRSKYHEIDLFVEETVVDTDLSE